MGMKFAFTVRRIGPRDLADEIASLADISRKQADGTGEGGNL